MSATAHPGLLRRYGLVTGVSLLVVIAAIMFGGPSVLLPIIALAAIEITFSFDNAVLNSQVLAKMSKIWRTLFLTVGIAIAVFGVRAILPLVLVSWASDNGLSQVLDQALHHPDVYAEELKSGYPIIAAFGGVFLLMVSLMFFGERKKVNWLKSIEKPLGNFNRPWLVSVTGATIAILLVYLVLSPGSNRIALAGLLGALIFLAVKGVSGFLLSRSKNSAHHGLIQFVYLELLDASFSFDGVVAAFAITKEVFLIVAGLGIGALYLRSMTLHLLEKGTLTNYRYLIHGAHYAILALSILLLAGIRFEVPEAVTGIIGLAIILVAFEGSRRHNKVTLTTV
ncbi:DUF475 domain-containing protein [Candidatus Saccharibacteria bacterium]|nr:DUF475 domain-containing protein [Candidatus Saccharibacteria bacterium]